MIIGTAGHIDHGKTALVRALTGIDTDRLPEEKRRGITIELGFAPLDFGDFGVAGVVDVPGHEALIRTMLAGATGIDVGLLIVAADEGPMPQTVEHVAILRHLAVPEVVVALTKIDLVDPDFVDLVELEVGELLQRNGYSAGVVRCSAVTGEGIAQLRDALRGTLARRLAQDPPSDDSVRLPIDRAFLVKGSGVVVTGTLWSGTIATHDQLNVFPGSGSVRVRTIHQFGSAVDSVARRSRVALAVSGVELSGIPRGAWLYRGEGWRPTALLHASLLLDTETEPIRDRETLQLHLGTTAVPARIVPFISTPEVARVVLREPVLCRSGDRFVLRRPGAGETIGGGLVLDPYPHSRRAKPAFSANSTAEERLVDIAKASGVSGASVAELPYRIPVGADVQQLVEKLAKKKKIERLGARIFSSATLSGLRQAIVAEVNSLSVSTDLFEGAFASLLSSTLSFPQEVTAQVVEQLVADGRILALSGRLYPSGWTGELSSELRSLRAELAAKVQAGQFDPPPLADLVKMHPRAAGILRALEKEGALLPIESDRLYSSEVVQSAISRLRGAFDGKGEFSPADAKAVVGSSRRFLIPFLEYCDRQRITERRSEGRVMLPARTA